VQDPQIQLQQLGIPVHDWMDPKREAVLDAAHRSFVNYETFFFADEGDKKRFDADPTASCGILTDPVSKRRFRPASDAPRVQHDGRIYLFLDDESKATFEKVPDLFARPNYDTIEIPGMPMELPTPPPAKAP
jgi:YHS domain-containing protein